MGIAKRRLNLPQAPLDPYVITTERVLDWISRQDRDTLLKLHEASRMRRDVLAQSAIMQFRVGDKVQWNSPRARQQVYGTVVSVGRKNIRVQQVGSMTTWRVPATLLQPWSG